MRILISEKAFNEHYASRTGGFIDKFKSLTGGGTVAGGVVGTAALAAGHAAAGASLWSLGSGLPLVGTFCAGKATAVGLAAATAALGSAAVLAPAILLGGGVTYAFYRKRGKRKLQKASDVENLARAFARVAFLPILAAAVSVCRSSPADAEAVREHVLKEVGAWGYSTVYAQDRFTEAMRFSPEALREEYEARIGKLQRGSTGDLGVTPAELPVDAVKGFAESFKRNFEECFA